MSHLSDQPQLPAPAAPDPAPDRQPRFSLALILAAAALAGLALLWVDTRSQVSALQQELAKRLAESEAQVKQAGATVTEIREAMRQADVKLGMLESRIAESQSQQVALEAMYQELARTGDDAAIAEVEQTLLIASQQLTLAGNVQAALIALASADARLQKLDRGQLTGLRKAIAKDIDQLRAVPQVDVAGISVQLDSLISAVDHLPLVMEVRPAAEKSAAAARVEGEGALAAFGRELWQEVRQLVRIQRVQTPEVPLLAPEQSFFLRENLKLRLLSARLSLIARDQATFKSDARSAREWLERYFDMKARLVITERDLLARLESTEVAIQLPDLSASLTALQHQKTIREKVR